MQNHHKDTPGKRRLKELEAAYANLKYWPKMKIPLNKWALSILVPWQGHPNYRRFKGCLSSVHSAFSSSNPLPLSDSVLCFLMIFFFPVYVCYPKESMLVTHFMIIISHINYTTIILLLPVSFMSLALCQSSLEKQIWPPCWQIKFLSLQNWVPYKSL